jgi:hypothetical protein
VLREWRSGSMELVDNIHEDVLRRPLVLAMVAALMAIATYYHVHYAIYVAAAYCAFVIIVHVVAVGAMNQ